MKSSYINALIQLNITYRNNQWYTHSFPLDREHIVYTMTHIIKDSKEEIERELIKYEKENRKL